MQDFVFLGEVLVELGSDHFVLEVDAPELLVVVDGLVVGGNL